MRPWTITFENHEAHLEAIAALRCASGLELGFHQDALWLKSDGDLLLDDLAVKQLPATARYYIDDENRLFRLGEITPCSTLPDLNWVPIADAISIEKPVAAMPAKMTSSIAVALVQARQEREPAALLLPFATLADWAEYAPAFRMEKLRFAVSEHGEALILGGEGAPLPPLPGQVFWRDGSLLFPAGYALAIPETAVLIEEKMHKQVSDIQVFILHVDGAWEGVHKADLRPLGRSAVRNTRKEVSDG
ncbi:MAG: hypothetical protein AB8F95_17385 [Bacteroidia bacterium]